MDIEKKIIKNPLRNQRGMSLVELMVTAAVIAALVAIAAPNYRKYQARARRVEGWNLMSTYFSQAISAKAEYGHFPGNFVETDFQPVGELGYRITVQDGTDINIAFRDNACTDTSAACDCAGLCAGFKTWVDTGLGTQGYPLLGPQPPAGAACGPVAPLGTTDTTFSIRGSGRIDAGAVNIDTLGMNERKVQQVCVDGVY